MKTVHRKFLYRHDIDGLRAIAVCAVILFHAGITQISGGFLGVDIFFVISGYLISSLIFIAKDNGTFSLGNFYQRRARRILPALCTVMLVCIPFACGWMFPEQLEDFWESLAAASLSFSNILFWVETSYFATIAEEKPLLHTWSLGVEEQFYLFFPLLLWCINLLSRRKLVLLATILFVACSSFLLSTWAWRVYPVANFYLLPFRAWEIALGVLVAWFKLYHKAKIAPKQQHILANIALMLLLLSLILFNKNIPHPSSITLIPLLATALLLMCDHPQTLSARILRQPIARKIGKISYSAYLWHQPIIAFSNIRFPAMPWWLSMGTSLLLTFVLAELTWRYIEQPFRNPQIIRQGYFIPTAISAVLAFALLGWQGHRLTAFDSSYPSTSQLFDSSYQVDDTCDNQFAARACRYGSLDNAHIALLGDSHAHALASELGAALKAKGHGLQLYVRGGCPPVPNIRVAIYAQDKQPSCADYNAEIATYLQETPSVDTIILAARWSAYLSVTHIAQPEKSRKGCFWCAWSGLASSQSVLQAYQAMVQGWLEQGKHVILVYPIPEPNWHVPHYLLQQARYNRLPSRLTRSYEDFIDENNHVYAAFAALSHPALDHAKPAERVCHDNACLLYDNGIAYYYDDDHVSSAGAALVVESIMAHF